MAHTRHAVGRLRPYLFRRLSRPVPRLLGACDLECWSRTTPYTSLLAPWQSCSASRPGWLGFHLFPALRLLKWLNYSTPCPRRSLFSALQRQALTIHAVFGMVMLSGTPSDMTLSELIGRTSLNKASVMWSPWLCQAFLLRILDLGWWPWPSLWLTGPPQCTNRRQGAAAAAADPDRLMLRADRPAPGLATGRPRIPDRWPTSLQEVIASRAPDLLSVSWAQPEWRYAATLH